MLLGPQRHKFTALDRAKQQGIGHYFIPRYTRMIETEKVNKTLIRHIKISVRIMLEIE